MDNRSQKRCKGKVCRGPDLELTDAGVGIESTLGARIWRDHPQCNSSRHDLVSNRVEGHDSTLTQGLEYAF